MPVTTTNIELTTEQQAAVRAIERWWRDPHGSQVFCVAGYAGTGKSTVVNHVIAELGVSRSRTAFLAYTGKAALVLQCKGLPARTIHSLIYGVEEDAAGKPRFTLRSDLPESYDLLVVDEVSMVSDDLLKDLLTFGVPILALGDPAQLPPVEGDSCGILDHPDAFLREIHRQAADNPILWASMLARRGEPIPMGSHGEALHVVPYRQVKFGEVDLEAFDQIICCTNKMRRQLNSTIRERRGFSGTLPMVGERLLSFRNVRESVSSASFTPLVNGLQGTVSVAPWNVDLEAERGQLSLALSDQADDVFSGLTVDLCRFVHPGEDHPRSLPGNGRLAQFDFGYAITAHKSQGSEFPRVLVILADIFAKDDTERRQLIYTAVTRASAHLTLAVRESRK